MILGPNNPKLIQCKYTTNSQKGVRRPRTENQVLLPELPTGLLELSRLKDGAVQDGPMASEFLLLGQPIKQGDLLSHS